MASKALVLPPVDSSVSDSAISPKKRSLPAGMKPWKKGQSGNPSGRPAKPLGDKLLSALVRNKGAEAALIAQAIIDQAKAGDVPAFIAIRDTVEGKPVQRTEGEQAITITIERVGS